jgi:hypothetical protein
VQAPGRTIAEVVVVLAEVLDGPATVGNARRARRLRVCAKGLNRALRTATLGYHAKPANVSQNLTFGD